MAGAGSIVDLKIFGESYPVTADSGFERGTPAETTATATSGDTLFSTESKVSTVEDVKIADPDGSIFEALLEVVGKEGDISFTIASGVVFSTPNGTINLKSTKFKDGITEVDLIPGGKKWQRG
jgi:hypothetical protein